MTYTATIYSYGFENQPDLVVAFTDCAFKKVWDAVITDIKIYAHDDAAYDGWRVKFEKDGTVLDLHIMVRCNPDTGWTDTFANVNGKTHYITSTLAQC